MWVYIINIKVGKTCLDYLGALGSVCVCVLEGGGVYMWGTHVASLF